METLLVALGIIGLVIFLVIIVLVYRYIKSNANRRPLINYNVADNYSDLPSEVKFDHSKNTKIWIGQSGLGNIIEKQQRDLLREQYEAYAAAMKVAKNWCNLSNLQNDHHRALADELPCIGHRQFSKFYHPMFDEKYGSQRITNKKVDSKRLLLLHYDTEQLPPISPSSPSKDNNPASPETRVSRIIDFQDEEQYRAFRLLFETIQHPYLLRTYEVTQSKDKRHLFIIRDLEKGGSLRDHIHCSDLSSAYGEKYSRPGKPLYIARIRKYGRQILEALHYLNRCGIGHFHLHSGNVIIQNDTAKLVEVENQFIGYQLRHPLHQHLQAVKKIYYDLDDQLCLFGYILFEMATGFESPTPSPLDSSEFLRKVDRNLVNILGRIFGDRSLGTVPTIRDLLEDPFFNAVNVPRSDISGFIALKQENETVDRLVTESRRQCLDRYSTETLLGDGVVRKSQGAGTPRKKKKKRKKKRDKSSASSPNGDHEPSMEPEPSMSSRAMSSRSVSRMHEELLSATKKSEKQLDVDPEDPVEESNVVSQGDRDEDSADDLWSSQ